MTTGGDPGSTTSLARLLLCGEDANCPWGHEDFGALLEDLLDAQLEAEVDGLTDDERAVGGTFRDLLTGGNALPSLLEKAKRSAKMHVRKPDGSLPPEVGKVLYFACLATALAQGQLKVTRLTNDELRRGFQWCLGQAWVAPDLREVMTKGLAALARAGAGKENA